MTAPTPAQNLVRVLRGLQMKRPILLEGSPGVGKTTLIQALASVSGASISCCRYENILAFGTKIPRFSY